MINHKRSSQEGGPVSNKPKDRRKIRDSQLIDAFIYDPDIFAKIWLTVKEGNKGNKKEIATKAKGFASGISPKKRQNWHNNGEIPIAFYDFLISEKTIPVDSRPSHKAERNINQLILELESLPDTNRNASLLRHALLEDISPVKPIVDKQLAARDPEKPRSEKHYPGRGIESLFVAMIK